MSEFEPEQLVRPELEIYFNGLAGAVVVDDRSQLAPEITETIKSGIDGIRYHLSLDRVIKLNSGTLNLLGIYVEFRYCDLRGYRYDKDAGMVFVPGPRKMVGFGAYVHGEPQYAPAREFDQAFLDRLEETNRTTTFSSKLGEI